MTFDPLPQPPNSGSATPPEPVTPSNAGDATSKPSGPRLNAVWPLLMVIVCVTIAELLLKTGAEATKESSAGSAVSSGISALASGFTIAGIVFHIAGFAAWMYALKWVPLSLAFNFISIQQVTVTLGAWWFLHEMISPMRWAGIGLAVIGVMLLVPAIVAVEQKTEGAA